MTDVMPMLDNVWLWILSMIVPSLITYIFTRRQYNLGNKNTEVDIMAKVIDTLQEEISRHKESVDKKDELIDKLYKKNDDLRDNNNSLTTKNAVLEYAKCTEDNCRKRKPPRIINDTDE